ncbi:MAG: porin family protein [Bacteroidetes bacterium]|nr:porin family protein [Bacteroidota bacterium]MBU1580421.1 porin family protein [Bacteroidota bacterium]MBU2465214.1 porin family protein [Bacteroidota bacterium]MBU2556730.1 porin family protein [Bacteroidota bacterium]
MRTKVLLTLLLITLMSVTSFAQLHEKRFGLELSTGASMATSKPGNTQLNTGFGFEGIFLYRLATHTDAYAGWGWNRFGADNSFAGADVCFEETGYVFGLQFKHPIGTMPLSYFLRAGGLYNHIEIENAAGNIIGDTGHGLGFQLAAGIDYALGKNWSITPGIKFNSLSRDVEMEGVTTKLNHNYLSLRIGFLKRF